MHQKNSCANCTHQDKSLFCDISHLESESLAENKKYLNFLKGQILFKEGMQPFGIYCIAKGKVKLSRLGESGKEHIVRLANLGDMVGYRALILNEPYRATAQTIEDSDICFIPRDYFLDMLKNNPDLANKLLQKLSNDLKYAENQIVGLAQKSVRERLAEVLLRLKATYGTETDNLTLNVTFSREELANIVGTSTETLIRVVHDFKEEKLIDAKGKKILINNISKLQRVANLYEQD